MRYDPPLRTMVTGDWVLDGTEPYPALVEGTWNGWAVPLFEREVAKRVVADQARAAAEYPEMPTLEWDGDAIIYRDPNSMTAEELAEGDRIWPDAEGRYPLGLGWTWYTAPGDDAYDPDDPTEAQVRAHERLRTSLRCDSGTRTVADDGTVYFAVMADLGRRDPRDGPNVPVIEQIARVRVDRDGTATVVTR